MMMGYGTVSQSTPGVRSAPRGAVSNGGVGRLFQGGPSLFSGADGEGNTPGQPGHLKRTLAHANPPTRRGFIWGVGAPEWT
jgi:hypothetical protein